MIRLLSVLSALLLVVVTGATAQPDTLTLQAFLGQVAANHPLAANADQYPLLAEAELRMARGGLDPVLQGEFSEKEYDGKNYYDKRSLGLKVPVGGLLDLSAGYERMDGEYLNPENTTLQFAPDFPDQEGSLIFAGFEIPLLRNLIIDDRRAALQQAKLLPGLAQAQRREKLNKLLLTASKAYWQWWLATEVVRLQMEGLALATFRLEAVRASVANGDMAAIDTVEAYNEVLLREVQLLEGRLLVVNTRLAAESFLWEPGFVPGTLPETRMPVLEVPEINDNPEQLVAFATTDHPAVVAGQVSLEQLSISERLARWNRLPEINLKYQSFLLSAYQGIPVAANYRLGLAVYVPILFRKERGKLQAMETKRFQAENDLENTRRQVTIGVRQAHNQYLNQAQMVRLQAGQLTQTERLLAGENTRFSNGESSLFLINQRERAVLSARLKLAELQAKRSQAGVELLYTAGWPLADLANPPAN